MKQRILIVEDDLTIQTQLKNLLSGNGYFVLPVYKNPPDIPPSHAHVLMVKQPKQ